jgi:hypothetical protein
MAAINTTLQLAKVRSQIDAQQQIISQLEMQMAIVMLGKTGSVKSIVDDIQGIYDGVTGGSYLGASFEKGVQSYVSDKYGSYLDLDTEQDEQDVVRHMLSTARALLGELRIQEQGYVQEVNSEKDSRKALIDFAKG